MKNQKSKEIKVFIEIEYKDESSFHFDVIPHDNFGNAAKAEIMMITRGTLMASGGIKATAYNEDGFEICSYIQ